MRGGARGIEVSPDSHGCFATQHLFVCVQSYLTDGFAISSRSLHAIFWLAPALSANCPFRVVEKCGEFHCFDISAEMLKRAQAAIPKNADIAGKVDVKYTLLQKNELPAQLTGHFDFVYSFDCLPSLPLCPLCPSCAIPRLLPTALPRHSAAVLLGILSPSSCSDNFC